MLAVLRGIPREKINFYAYFAGRYNGHFWGNSLI